MIFLMIFLVSVSTPTPLLDADDSIARGATAMYTISLEEGYEYWILLDFDETGGMDLDIIVASDEMDYNSFIQMPYFEDYMYSRDFSLVEGASEGVEDLVLTAPYTGTAYIIIHDIGETGGDYHLRIF
ncbi:MAG: hypothetical protein K8R76_00570 [Candidatus Aegiribacteria sp.]|nr:hypothetical protein [Candidatus Aegiribacteria sp.]